MARNKNEVSELADLLRRAIMTGELRPRERLVEAVLAERYRVSRTPVREAIRHLEALGLVTRERYKGAMVADINLNELREMQEVRAYLEGLAASLAAARLSDEDLQRLAACEREMEQAAMDGDVQLFSARNEEFHRIFYMGSGNQYLYQTILNLLKHSWHEPCSSWRALGDIPGTVEGHRQILLALQIRDPEQARRAAQQHIMDSVRVQDVLARDGNVFFPPVISRRLVE